MKLRDITGTIQGKGDWYVELIRRRKIRPDEVTLVSHDGERHVLHEGDSFAFTFTIDMKQP